MTPKFMHMLCHQVVAAHDKGGDELATAIEKLRIALSGKTKDEYISELDNTPLAFGKYKGSTPEEVAVIDPGYIVWMFNHVSPAKCSKELKDGCEYDLTNNQRSEFDHIRPARFEWARFDSSGNVGISATEIRISPIDFELRAQAAEF